MIIDAHTHIGKLPGSKYAADYKKNLELLLKEAADNKIDHLIVIAGFEKENGINISTKSLLDLTAGLKNVSAVAGINVEYQKEDIAQLELWCSEKMIVGIKFNTGYQHYYPSDERCRPIYEIALRHNLPVIFHSGDTLAGVVRNPKVKYSHPLHVDEVAADLPDLKIIIAHMGNPWLVDCAEVLYKNPNVYADISGLVVGEDLKTPYGAIMKAKIRELMDYVGPRNKLLYGTDWPLASMETYVAFADSLDLSKDAKEYLFYKNAANLFGLYRSK